MLSSSVHLSYALFLSYASLLCSLAQFISLMLSFKAVGNPCERHRPKRDLSSSVLTMDKKRPAEPEPFDPEVKYWFDWFIKKYGKPYR